MGNFPSHKRAGSTRRQSSVRSGASKPVVVGCLSACLLVAILFAMVDGSSTTDARSNAGQQNVPHVLPLPTPPRAELYVPKTGEVCFQYNPTLGRDYAYAYTLTGEWYDLSGTLMVSFRDVTDYGDVRVFSAECHIDSNDLRRKTRIEERSAAWISSFGQSETQSRHKLAGTLRPTATFVFELMKPGPQWTDEFSSTYYLEKGKAVVTGRRESRVLAQDGTQVTVEHTVSIKDPRNLLGFEGRGVFVFDTKLGMPISYEFDGTTRNPSLGLKQEEIPIEFRCELVPAGTAPIDK